MTQVYICDKCGKVAKEIRLLDELVVRTRSVTGEAKEQEKFDVCAQCKTDVLKTLQHPTHVPMEPIMKTTGSAR